MSIYVNAYSTVRDDVPWVGTGAGPTYTRTLVAEGPFLAEQPEGSEELDLQEHLNGFATYASEQGAQRAGEYNPSIHSVFQHINRVCRHYVFERPEDFDLSEFSTWARQANAIFFLPDGTVRNGEGVDLLDPANAQGYNLVTAPNTAESIARRDRIRGRLWEEGLRISPFLPPVISESEVVLRRPEEVLQRAKAVAATAGAAVNVLEGKAVNVPELREHGGPAEVYTDNEARFLDAVERFNELDSVQYPAELREQAVQLRWGFIAAELLAWVIGVVDSDPFELVALEPHELWGPLESVNDPRSLSPRSLEQICDAWEYTFSMRWFAVDQALKAQESDHQGLAQVVQPNSFHLDATQGSILLERHRALSWLISPNVDYDEVDLST